MDAYVVVGERHSYKSSTIRSLSGSRVRGVRPYVLLPKRLTQVFVYLSSLQEGVGISPADFEKLVATTDASACLFPLHPRGSGAYPDADGYLTHFIRRGWTIRRVAVLNATSSPLHTVALGRGVLRLFPLGAPPVAVNQLAADVRVHFGWL